MPAKMNLKNVKGRLKDETLDLSLCDLEEVPVREIAAVRKASYLDLSNNLLVSLPTTFVTLKQVVKLDLSRNMLKEIPENIGEMKQLKHLDLYANQISRLPLSFCELKNLRWLDLKENPLTPAVASVAGPCSNMGECQACARNIVAYLSNVKLTIGEEKFRRVNAGGAGDMDTEATSKEGKKESKKKKKKSAEKENKKTMEKNGSKPPSKISRQEENEEKPLLSVPNHNYDNKKCPSKGDSCNNGFCRSFLSVILWFSLFLLIFVLSVVTVSLIYKEESEIVLDYLEERSGVSLKTFQKQSAELLDLLLRSTVSWANNIYGTLNEAYAKYFETKAK